MDEELRGAFRRVGKAEWVMLVLMAILVAVTAGSYYVQYDSEQAKRDEAEAYADVSFVNEQQEDGSWRYSVSVTADEGYDLFDLSLYIGFQGYGFINYLGSIAAGETRTIEGNNSYPVQEASVEGGSYHHVS